MTTSHENKELCARYGFLCNVSFRVLNSSKVLKFPKDIFSSEICYRKDEFVIGPRVVQFIMVIELSGVQFGLKSYA